MLVSTVNMRVVGLELQYAADALIDVSYSKSRRTREIHTKDGSITLGI